MKKVLIFNANPGIDSFNSNICRSYLKGVQSSGADAELINLIDLDFDPVLRGGFSGEQELEKDLKEVQAKIKNAEHLVFVYPTWWGTYPALLKGFIDRVFTPGFAFKYRDNSLRWDKLLTGKTAGIITTMDTPKLYYKLYYKSPGTTSLRKNILEFCGIKTVNTTIFSPVKKSTKNQREAWLKTAEKLGKQIK